MLWKKSAKGTYDLRSVRPNLVLVLATQCLWWGWGVRGGEGCSGHMGLHMKNSLLSTLESTLENCSLLQTIAHELRAMRPKIVPLLATRCLYVGALRAYGGDGCGRVHLTKHHPDPQADGMLC